MEKNTSKHHTKEQKPERYVQKENVTPQKSPNVPNTPKRALDFSSPGSSRSPMLSPGGKKSCLFGYLLCHTPILKGKGNKPYYDFQLQTSEGVAQRITGYDTKKHPEIQHKFATGERVAVEVKVSLKDQSLFFGDNCFIRTANEIEVPFQLDLKLKSELIKQGESQEIDIKSLLDIDAHQNKTKFTVTGLVTMGSEELETFQSSFGTTRIKKDIIVEDSTGHIELRLYESQLSSGKFQNGKSQRMSHMALKVFQRKPYLGATRETTVEIVPDLNIQSTANQLLAGAINSLVATEFTGVRDLQIFNTCPSCKKKLNIIDETPLFVVDACGDATKKSRLKKKNYSCVVEFVCKEELQLAAIFSDTLEKTFPMENPTEKEIRDFFFSQENISLLLSGEKPNLTITKFGDG